MDPPLGTTGLQDSCKKLLLLQSYCLVVDSIITVKHVTEYLLYQENKIFNQCTLEPVAYRTERVWNMVLMTYRCFVNDLNEYEKYLKNRLYDI